jgi:hypothetical protein
VVDQFLELSFHAIDAFAELTKVVLHTANRPEDFVHLAGQILVFHTHHVHFGPGRTASIGFPAFTMTAFNVHDLGVQQKACVFPRVGHCTNAMVN